MKQRLLSLVLLAFLPLLAVQAQTTNYDLRICGTQVTSANASDVLGDGVFSYNAATQTLTVSGDCTTYNAGNIIESDIDGLVINVATDSKLWLDEGGASSLKVLSLTGNTTIKGNGELSISAMDYGYGIYTNSSLTIEDMKLSLEAHYSCIYLFYGHNNSDPQLTIRNSRVFAYSEDDHDPAFKVNGSLVLEGCYVSRPSGGYVYGSTIVDSNGNPSRDLTISIGENPNPIVPYELVICGKRVTNRTASDVLGDGVFSYDAETQTLTVSGDCTYERENNIINSGIEGLVIDVTANSELKTTSLYNADVMCLAKNTTIKGDGKLTITSESMGGLYFTSSSSVTIEDMNIEANCFNECFISSSGYASKGDLTIRNSTIHAQTQSDNRKAFSCSGGIVLEDSHITQPVGGYVLEGYIVDSEGNKAQEVTIEPGDDPNPVQLYDLFICGSRVTNRNASDVLGDGAFSYDAENKVLTVSGDASTYEEYIIYNKATDGCEGIDGLTIDFQKDVKFTTTGREGTYILSYGCIRLESNTTFKGEGKLTMESSGFGLTSHKSLTIEGMTIEANCSHDGFVGYYSNPSPIRIISSDIHVKAGANYAAFSSFSEFTLEGCQIIQPDGAYLDVNNSNSIVDSYGNIATEVLIMHEGAEVYDLSICGTLVTSVNASDILGDGAFSYNPETKTLTMSGNIIRDEGEIGETILSRIDDLIIDIVDDVTLQCKDSGFALYANALLKGTGVLTIDSEESCGIYVNDAQLTIEGMTIEANGRWGIVGNPDEEYLIVRNSTIHATGTTGAVCDFTSITLEGCEITLPEGGTVDGGNIVDSEGNIAKEVLIMPEGTEVYGLSICGTLVTSANASDILGDGAFSYDPATKTLNLKGDSDFDSDYAIKSYVEDLIINVANDEIYLWGNNRGIELHQNTLIKGQGSLNVDSGDAAIYVESCTLTIEGMDLNLFANGSCGFTSSEGSLVVRHSYVNATGDGGAIYNFNNITLENCKIALPSGGFVRNGSIIDSEGNLATEVNIVPNIKEYDLIICGTIVNSVNKADVLGDGAFSFDSETNTLAVKGNAHVYNEPVAIIESYIDSLVINIANDVTLQSLKTTIPIFVNAKALLTGTGTLSLITEEGYGMLVNELTIDGLTLDINSIYNGIKGFGNGKLSIRNSNIHVKATDAAICDFSSIRLEGCSITLPEGGTVDGGNIVDSEGNVATEVIIEPVPEEGELMICRKLVTDDNANDVLEDGVFRFNASSKTLYINGDCTYDGTIIDSRLSSLTIVSEGVSSLHSLESETIKGYNLTFKNSYPTKVVSDNDAAIRLLFKMPTIPVESMQTEIEGHLTIDGCEMEIEGKNYGLYSDVSWDMISDGVLQPQGYYNLYLYTYLTIVNSELIVRGNEAAIYHFTEMNCSGYPVIKPSAGEYHTGYVGNIINPTEFYYQDQTDPNNPKPATEVIIGDSTTAIHDIAANVDTKYSNAVRYNLSGQRVGRDYRGIVIENGKKILVK